MLKLTFSGDQCKEYKWHVAEALQKIPGVLRVRVECSVDRIEIIYSTPADGLLRTIHESLPVRLAGEFSGQPHKLPAGTVIMGRQVP